jgi:hypothetical protein
MSILDTADNTARKQRGRPFEQGKSGNPKGRPKGARNQATIFAEQLIEGETESIVRKLVDTALQGDTTALRICLERLVAPKRERRVAFALPKIQSAADAADASAVVLAECAAGNLSPSEASEIMALISAHVRVLEVNELEGRIAALENGTRS